MTERTDQHWQEHAQAEARIRAIIVQSRDLIGLESAWSIELCVLCPERLPEHEASIWWDAEYFYARIHIRCGLPEDLECWLVKHELCELQQWRTGNAFWKLLDRLYPRERLLHPRALREREQLQRAWMMERNQEIECRLYGLLGQRRPGHLME